MFREFILLICTITCAFGGYRIIFDKDFSPPARIPAAKDMYYSVPLNQTISKPIIAYISHTDGTRVWSGAYSNDVYTVISMDSTRASHKVDPWHTSGGKLCQRAVWWEDYPTKLDKSREQTRCGDATASTTLFATAFNGRLILDGIFHQHYIVPTPTRILRIIHKSTNLQGDTNPFKITQTAEYVEVYVQPPKTVLANTDFSITVRIRDQSLLEVDTGLDSIAVVELSIPYSLKIFYNTEEKVMMLKSTSVRLAGKETIMHQSNRDRVIRKTATAGKAIFNFIRILDPVKAIKINVTMMKARTPRTRIPVCEACSDDLDYRKYFANRTEFTFQPMSSAVIKRTRSLTFTDSFEVMQQTIHKISFSKKTLDLWNKWTDPGSKTVSVIKNVKVVGEILLEAFDKRGERIYAGDDANFTLKYTTIPSGICLSNDITKNVEQGSAHLSLSFCEIVNDVQLLISMERKPSVSVNTVHFRVIGTINVAHIGDLRNKRYTDSLAPYLDSFLHFAAQDINKGNMYKNLSQAGFSIKVVSYNTMNYAEFFTQISKFTDDRVSPASRYQVAIVSASDEIAKAINVQLMKSRIPCISTNNIDTEFSDKFVYPFFNRICWSQYSNWKSFAMAVRDRNWYTLVVVRDEEVKISETFFDILTANGIVVGREIIIPVIGSNMKNQPGVTIFYEQMKSIQEYMCKVILLFAGAESQPYIFTAAQIAGVDSTHGFQWVILSEYVWNFPFTNPRPCSDERLSCTQAFKGIYLMIDSYNVSGYTTEEWQRVLRYYYSTNKNDLTGGIINHEPYEAGSKIALGYDAVSVFANAFLKIVLKHETISEYAITKVIRQSEVNGLTGKIKINDKGDRIGYIGVLAQIKPKVLSSDQRMKQFINYLRLLQTISDDEQLEFPFVGTSSLYNVAKLYLPPSRKYNMIRFATMSGMISLQNQTLIRNPCEPWPPQRYVRVEKVIPVYICEIDCGFKLLSDSNVTNYDSGVCIEGNECKCKPGYAGSTCTIILCKCAHGKCTKPNLCTCEPGWADETCAQAMCTSCVHGKCVSPDECDCDSSWTGSACDINIWAIIIPLIIILILLAILAYFQLRRFTRHLRYLEVMTTNDWIVEWKTVELCNMDEYYRIWLVISPNKKARYFAQTYRWKGKNWYVKKIPNSSIPLEDIEFRTEMVTLIKIKHKNLVSFAGACIDAPNVSLFLQVADRGSLIDVLMLDTLEFSWDFRYSFMKDICCGMNYLHQKTSIGSHGRLKSSNCLVDYRWSIRVSGYGAPTLRYGSYRKDMDEEIEDVKLFFWTAPELQRHAVNLDSIKNGTKPGDVYAFAIIVAEILTRNEAFAYELCYISERALVSLIRDYTSPVLRVSRTKWRQLAGPNMRYIRPILEERYLGFNMTHRNIVRRMLADAWNQTPSARPTFKKLLSLLHSIHPIKAGSTENQIDLLVTYTKNLEIILMERMIEFGINTEKYELLISQLLPRKYTADIKAGRNVPPKEFECITVFTSDIPDFYIISKSSTPHQMVNFLNEVLHLFEQVVSAYNVYTVDSINEFHMVVGGLDGSTGKQNVGEIATMALDLLSSVNVFKIPHKRDVLLELRAGIHSGPALVGVVGRASPRYFVLGQTIEIALNLLQTSQPLRIHISTATAGILESLGGYEIESILKNKTLDSYWLWGKVNFKMLREHRRKRSSMKPKKGEK